MIDKAFGIFDPPPTKINYKVDKIFKKSLKGISDFNKIKKFESKSQYSGG